MTRAISAAGAPMFKHAAGAVARHVPIATPVLLVGPGAAVRLAQAVAAFAHRRLLVVASPVATRGGLAGPVLEALRRGGVVVSVFDAVSPDAPLPMVEQALAQFNADGCDALLAFGGGSVIDTAKVVGLAAANHKAPRDLAGYFRGLHAPVPIYAMPTTAGTGSEVSVAAVIADPEAGRKLLVADTRIVPAMAALDPALTLGMPRQLTAATGMDALTHAVEACISAWATPATDRFALAAVEMIWRCLPQVVQHGDDTQAREQMALASCYAGLAFTRANVGNVHALAHQIGARYHTPHGLANALLLPHVLRWSLGVTTARLARLARRVGLAGDDEQRLAEDFIVALAALAAEIGIPEHLAALREIDIAGLAKAACREADLNYPVPRRMDDADAQGLLRRLLPGRDEDPAARRRSARRVATP